MITSQSKAKQKKFSDMGASHSLYALQLIKNIVYSQKAMAPSGWRVKVGIVCVWVAANCDPLVTHGTYLSALEMLYGKGLYRFTFTLIYFIMINRHVNNTR